MKTNFGYCNFKEHGFFFNFVVDKDLNHRLNKREIRG